MACVLKYVMATQEKSDQTSFQKWTDQTENLAMLQNLPQVSVILEGLVHGMPHWCHEFGEVPIKSEGSGH